MTTKLPSSCLRTVSLYYNTSNHNAALRFRFRFRLRNPTIAIAIAYQIRGYASQTPNSDQTPSKDDLARHERLALGEVQGLLKSSAINPPRSTLPPPLQLPSRDEYHNVAVYYFRIGRAYGSFYWIGIKAVWFNYQASKLLKQRIQQTTGERWTGGTVKGMMTRGEFQLLERNNYDIGKLPFFGILVALFGEWLPLIVPFIPGAVPGTCRIPKQIEGMRRKSEERRNASFRGGIEEPKDEDEHMAVVARREQAEETQRTTKMLEKLRHDQLLHLSCTLNLHNRIWDRLGVAPPSAMLRKKVAKHISYLATDDTLLLQAKGNAAKLLESEEIQIACEERGLDVLGKREEVLRFTLHEWLERQKREREQGSEWKSMLKMLFRRPNAWNTETKATRREGRD